MVRDLATSIRPKGKRRRTKAFTKVRIVFLPKRWSAIAKRIDATSVVMNKVMHIALVL